MSNITTKATFNFVVQSSRYRAPRLSNAYIDGKDPQKSYLFLYKYRGGSVNLSESELRNQSDIRLLERDLHTHRVNSVTIPYETRFG